MSLCNKIFANKSDGKQWKYKHEKDKYYKKDKYYAETPDLEESTGHRSPCFK